MALALSRATVLGDPDIRAWEELATLPGQLQTELLWFGTYVITRAEKPGLMPDRLP